MTNSFRFHKIEAQELDFKALKRTATQDPVGLLNLCRDQHRCINSGTRRLHWELLTSIYASALSFRDDSNQFEQLLKHEWFLNRSYEAKRKDALRLAILIGTNAEAEGLNYKKACKEAQKLQPFFDDDVSPENVLAEIIKAKGLKHLTRGESSEERPEVEEADLDDESDCREVDHPEVEQTKKPGVTLKLPPEVVAAHTGAPLKTRPERTNKPKYFNPDCDLVANAGYLLHSLLQTPKETEVWIKIRAKNDLGEFRLFDVVDVKESEGADI